MAAGHRPPGAQKGLAQPALALLENLAVERLAQFGRRSILRKAGWAQHGDGAARGALQHRFAQTVRPRHFVARGQAGERDHNRRPGGIGHGRHIRPRQQVLGPEVFDAAMAGVVNESGTLLEPVQEVRARGGNCHLIQVDAVRQAIRGRDQGRQPVVHVRETGHGGIRLVGGQPDFLLPRCAEAGFVGLDLGDHGREFRTRPRRQAADCKIRAGIVVCVRQQAICGAHAGRSLDQKRRQGIGFAGVDTQIIVMPVAGQHGHRRRFRPGGRGIFQQSRNGLGRALTPGQQVTDILEDGQPGAQPLPGPIVHQFLRRRRQRPGGDHQVVDLVAGRQEPGLRRRRFRNQQRHGFRFHHRESLVRTGRGPGLGGQPAVSIDDPGRGSVFVQGQGQGLGECRRGNSGGAARAEVRCGRAAGFQPPVESGLDPIRHEETFGMARQKDPLDRQRVGTVHDHRGRDR